MYQPCLSLSDEAKGGPSSKSEGEDQSTISELTEDPINLPESGSKSYKWSDLKLFPGAL